MLYRVIQRIELREIGLSFSHCVDFTNVNRMSALPWRLRYKN
jgi:hypothetical protein